MERTKGKRQSRTLVTAPVAAEDIGFAFAQQVGRITRQYEGRTNEAEALITSQAPAQLPACVWLLANRLSWGIETGLHLRLDVSLREDLCRVREPNALWILGMLRRLTVSLFMAWRGRQRKAKHKTLTDFQSDLGADNLAKAMHFMTTKHPKL